MILFLLQIFLGLLALAILRYFFFSWSPNHFKKMGVPSPFAWPFIGQTREMMKKGFLKSECDWAQKYGRVVGVFEGTNAMLLIRDPDMLQQITVKNFHAFTNRRSFQTGDTFVDLQLTGLKDDHWRHVRHLMVPTFSTARLKIATVEINDCAKLLTKNIEKAIAESPVVDLKMYAGAFTMDVIARTAFGIQVDSQQNKDNPFVVHAHKSMNQTIFRPAVLIAFFFPIFRPLFKYFKMSFFPPDSEAFFRNVVDKIIDGRLDGSSTHGNDFLQLMMNAHKERLGAEETNDKPSGTAREEKGLTREELEAQSVLFLLAGYDTTASSIGFLLYNMALNPDCQEKLYQEIKQACGDKTLLDYETVSNLEYLDRCYQESMRIFPPAIRVDRQASEDINICGIDIPKGHAIGIQMYQVHHDPLLWPDPEKFDPERFTPEAKASHHPCQYIPFGYGPRICIGMRLAQIEAKVAVTYLIRDFRFSRCAETEVPIKFNNGGLLQPLNGIKLKIEKRS